MSVDARLRDWATDRLLTTAIICGNRVVFRVCSNAVEA